MGEIVVALLLMLSGHAAGRFPDADGDGFGRREDCNDRDARIHPGATEICNGANDDCDPATSESGMVSVNGTAYGTIQDAVDDASRGDTVLICDGTFYENVVVSRSVVLQGMGANVSVIDGGGAAKSVVGLATDDWWEGIHLTVRGLTLQHGTGDPISGGGTETGGGIQAEGAAVLVVEDCVVADNTANYGGGVRGSYYGQTFLRDSTFRGNTASRHGGGAYLTSDPGSLYGSGGLDIEGCEFLDNTAVGDGGGIWIGSAAGSGGGDVTITDTLIDGNTTTSYTTTAGAEGGLGGGMYLGGDTATLSGVTISNNESELAGGGVYATVDEVIADDNTVVSGNSTHDGGSGGGCYCWATEWTGGRFESNTAAIGGGLYLWGYTTGGGDLDGATVEGNHATELGGGVAMGIYTEIRNSVITANTSDLVGGGIGTIEDEDEAHTASVSDSTITANVASVSGGGAHVQMTFESDNCDWGAGATDNDPDDVSLVSTAGDFRSYDAFGAAEDFVCNLDRGRCR